MEKKRFRLGAALSVSLVSGLALVTIFGLLASDDSGLAIVSDFLLQFVAVIAAFAVLIGVLNLLVFVHLSRVFTRQSGMFYSLISIVSAVLVISVYIADRTDRWTGDLKDQELTPRLFSVLQITLESALASLILFFLVYAAYRLMHKEFTWSNVLFIGAILIVLLGWLPVGGLADLADVREWLLKVPVTSGARGLLIGIGLGTVVIGVRVLLAHDSIYRQKLRERPSKN